LAAEAASGQISPENENVVRGLVINSVTREPVGHALVYSADKRFATFTDDQGHFQFVVPSTPEASPPSVNETVSIDGANFVGASYSTFPSVLLARKPGFLSPEKSRSPWDVVIVEPGRDVTIALVPEARIVGSVVLPSSNAADRIVVHLYRRRVVDGRARWEVSSELAARSNGEYRFAGLEAGTYKVFTGELMDRDPLTFNPAGLVYGYPPSYFPTASNFQGADEIHLAAGMTFQADLSPMRQPYYNVKLPVTNAPADEQLIVGVAIQGRKGPGLELGYNPRNQRIEGSLPNGTYLIEATTQGQKNSSASATITVKGSPVGGPPITLVPNGSVQIETKLEFAQEEQKERAPVARTEGNSSGDFGSVFQVQFENFSVRLDSDLEFTQETPNGISTFTRRDNTALLEGVPPGRYWVKVNSLLGFAASVRAGDIDLLRQPLTVHPGANLRVDIDLRNDGAEISGTVEGGRKSNVSTMASRARGFLYCIPLPDGLGQFRETQAGQDGSFQFNQLPPGSYRVLAFDRPQTDLEFRNADAMRMFENKGQNVRLSAGQKEHLTLQLIASNE